MKRTRVLLAKDEKKRVEVVLKYDHPYAYKADAVKEFEALTDVLHEALQKKFYASAIKLREGG